MAESFLREQIKARTTERRWMRNPSSCVTPAGTSNELVQNEWEENTHIHTLYNREQIAGEKTPMST